MLHIIISRGAVCRKRIICRRRAHRGYRVVFTRISRDLYANIIMFRTPLLPRHREYQENEEHRGASWPCAVAGPGRGRAWLSFFSSPPYSTVRSHKGLGGIDPRLRPKTAGESTGARIRVMKHDDYYYDGYDGSGGDNTDMKIIII